MGDYRKWLASDEAKKFVIDNVKKSGIPLELRARKVLKDNRFNVTSTRYLDPDSDNSDVDLDLGQGVWRELDLLATRAEETTLNISECEIRFVTNILGECKYSSEKDVLVFEHPDPENADLSHFPLLVNGQYILSTPLRTNFSLPLLVERLIEVDANSASKEKGNFSDMAMHRASEQMLSALRYFLHRWRESIRKHYIDVAKASLIREKWDNLLKEKKVPYEEFGSHSRVPNSFINNFLRENFEPTKMLQDFPFIPIYVYFPLIITDEDRGVVRAKLNDSYDVVDLEDIGLCVYTYVSENADRYVTVLENAFVLPILICSLPNLNSVIRLIDEGMSRVTEQTRQKLIENPYLIPREVLFNDKVIGF